MTHIESLKRLISPFYFSQKLLSPPPKGSFKKYKTGPFLVNLRTLFHRWRKKEEREAEIFFNSGFQSHGMGKIEVAIQQYESCIAIDSLHFAALNNLAGAYAHLKEYSKARDFLEQALFGTRGIAMVYYNLGLLFRVMDQQDKAIDSFEKAIELKDHFWAHVNLAEILVDRVQLKDAIAHYLLSLPQAPDPWMIKLRLAELYYLDNDLPNAEFVSREILNHRETPELLYNLAWLLLVQEKAVPEAIQLFRKARLKKSPYHESLFNQAVAESINGDFEDSLLHMKNYTNQTTPLEVHQLVRNIRVLTKVNGNNIEAALKIATYLFDEGYDDDAIRELRLLLRRKPDHVDALKQLSVFEYETGQKNMAIATCKKILNIAPDKNCLDTYLLLAKVYGTNEDYDNAMPYVKKALEINPSLPELNYQYATFLAQKGEFNRSLKYYKQIAATSPSYPRIHTRIRMVEEEIRERNARIK